MCYVCKPIKNNTDVVSLTDISQLSIGDIVFYYDSVDCVRSSLFTVVLNIELYNRLKQIVSCNYCRDNFVLIKDEGSSNGTTWMPVNRLFTSRFCLDGKNYLKAHSKIEPLFYGELIKLIKGN